MTCRSVRGPKRPRIAGTAHLPQALGARISLPNRVVFPRSAALGGVAVETLPRASTHDICKKCASPSPATTARITT